MLDDPSAHFYALSGKPVELISVIVDKPWGMRELGIRTPDGYRLMIGHRLSA
ncbi:MAG: hypothetical protein O3B24_04020 [Verrucomicrobia bacterium]|nr:hypothetical protein [Verrucomicrobiota bacterium]